MTDEELKALVASLAISQAKTDEQMRKTDEQMKKTDKGWDELRKSQAKIDEQMRKTDEQMKKTDKGWDELRKSQAEASEQIKELGRKIDKLGKLFGDFGNTRGEEIEEFFYRYFQKNKELQGIKFDDVDRNIITAEGQEDDIVMVNGKASTLISVKHKAKKEDIDSLVEKEMTRMKYFLNKLGSHHRLYGGIASYIMGEKVAEYAKSKGLFVITRSGDNTIFLNDKNFVAKSF